MIRAVLIISGIIAIGITSILMATTSGDTRKEEPPTQGHETSTAQPPTARPQESSAWAPTPDDPEEQERERQRQRAIKEKNPELLPVCTQEQLDNIPEVTRPSPESVWDAVECKAPPPTGDEIQKGPRSGAGK